jgi:hypothetical protein
MVNRSADALRQDRDRLIGFAFANADLLPDLAESLLTVGAGGAVRSLLRLGSGKAIGRPLGQFISQLDTSRAEPAMRKLRPGERHKDLLLDLVISAGDPVPVSASVYRGLNPQKAQNDLAVARRAATPGACSPRAGRDREPTCITRPEGRT